MTYFWFRRDLRLSDNAGLFNALKAGNPVQCVFIFDTQSRSTLADKTDARVSFIHQQLERIKSELQEHGADLEVHYGTPQTVWAKLIQDNKPKAIYCNHDYEPYAMQRDHEIEELARQQGTAFHTFKDHVIFEKDEVVKDDGSPYVVFTPYSKKWKSKSNDFYLKSYPSEGLLSKTLKRTKVPMISLRDMGFEHNKMTFPPTQTTLGIIRHYGDRRDYPGIVGTSRLSVHFRFGSISIREMARKAKKTSEKWLNELIWRDFYASILYHFPHVVGNAFRPKYDHVPWRKSEEDFEAWKTGNTGYPIVDAGMRELNTTGWMHNRVRMITASFFTKHLLLDWRLGEAYFAQKLNDFDLASNNGGWQWAAGCGVDAAPYFRIFNPHTQLTKFDKDLSYVKKWVPEYGTTSYTQEIVEHSFARKRCLETYKTALDAL